MFTGSMVAIVTPMHANGEVDYDSLSNLIEWHIESGTDAIISVGTTGESATLDPKEHTDVIKFTYQQVRNRIPVIAGTGANSTSEAILLTRKAKEIDVDACLLVVPYYNKPTQQGLFEHYKLIADSVDIPQILYNVPSRTVTDLNPATVIRLANHQNIIGIKEASGDLTRVRTYRQNCDNFLIVSGEDDNLAEFIKCGGNGIISVTANVLPAKIAEICKLGLAGNHDSAATRHENLQLMHKAMFVESSPIPAKYALWKMGIIDKGIRLPLTWLNPEYHSAVDEQLTFHNLI